MAKAKPSLSPLTLREALKCVGFEVLRPYLHTGRIPAHHRGMYTPGGKMRYGPGDIPQAWWANAYKDPAGRDPDGRVFFIIEWEEDGRVIQEKLYAYTIDIDLGPAAFERYFPAAAGPAAESDGTQAAQESIPEPNAETASSVAAASYPATPQTKPESPASKNTPMPREQLGEPTVDSASGEAVPAPASVADASVSVANTKARREQSQWLKTALANNPPDKDEPLTPEGYGKRIAEMGRPLGAMYEPSSVIARYYQLNPGTRRRRKPQK